MLYSADLRKRFKCRSVRGANDRYRWANGDGLAPVFRAVVPGPPARTGLREFAASRCHGLGGTVQRSAPRRQPAARAQLRREPPLIPSGGHVGGHGHAHAGPLAHGAGQVSIARTQKTARAPTRAVFCADCLWGVGPPEVSRQPPEVAFDDRLSGPHGRDYLPVPLRDSHVAVSAVPFR